MRFRVAFLFFALNFLFEVSIHAIECKGMLVGEPATQGQSASKAQFTAGQRIYVTHNNQAKEVNFEFLNRDGSISVYDSNSETHFNVNSEDILPKDRWQEAKINRDEALRELFRRSDRSAQSFVEQFNVSHDPFDQSKAKVEFDNKMQKLDQRIWSLGERHPDKMQEVEAAQEAWLEVEQKIDAIRKSGDIDLDQESVFSLFIPEGLNSGTDIHDLKGKLEEFKKNLESYREKFQALNNLKSKADGLSFEVNKSKSSLIKKYTQIIKDPRSVEVFNKAEQLRTEFDKVFSASNEEGKDSGIWATLRKKLSIPLLKRNESESSQASAQTSTDPELLIEANSDLSPYEFDLLLHSLRNQGSDSQKIAKLEKLVTEYRALYQKSPVALVSTLRADYSLLRKSQELRAELYRDATQHLQRPIGEINAEISKAGQTLSSAKRDVSRVGTTWHSLSLDNLTLPSRDRGGGTFQLPQTPGYTPLGISPQQHAHIERHFQEATLRQLEPDFYGLKAKLDGGELTREEFTAQFQAQLDQTLKSNVEDVLRNSGTKELHSVFPAYIRSRDVFETLSKNPEFNEWLKEPKPSGSVGARGQSFSTGIVPWEGNLLLKGKVYKIHVWVCALKAGCSGGYQKRDVVTLYPVSGDGVVQFQK